MDLKPGDRPRRHFKATGTTNPIAIDLDGPGYAFYIVNQGPNGVMIGPPSISGSLASDGMLVPANSSFGPEIMSNQGWLVCTVSGTAVVGGYIV
jgi:hypothetical protein